MVMVMATHNGASTNTSPPPQSNSSMSSDLIPERLLAMAKDERYVKQCHELIQQLLSSAGTENNHFQHIGFSWLLYALVVVVARQKSSATLGMQFMGLQSNSNRRLWVGMAASALISIGIDHHCNQTSCSQNNNGEALRGQARRRYYEQQRRTMMQQERENITTNDSMAATTTSLWTRLKQQFRHLLLELSPSTISQQGPNNVLLTTDNAAIITPARWILRLALARLILRSATIRSGRSNSVLANRPNLHRLVALLILQQASVLSIKTMIQGITRMYTRRLRGDVEPGTTAAGTTAGKSTTADKSTTTANTSTTTTCGICRLPRTCPAAPKACGHVFCWKCLQQCLTQTKKHECPLCRAPCRPQDVLALHSA